MHSTNAPVQHPRTWFWLRLVILSLVLILLAFFGFDFWFYRAVKNSQAQRDGSIRLVGLTAPVTVAYDSLGVPNISAANIPDLFFAQGYVTAQDRLWQMDMLRRYTWAIWP